jgi:hypothetical protein
MLRNASGRGGRGFAHGFRYLASRYLKPVGNLDVDLIYALYSVVEDLNRLVGLEARL